MMRSNDYGQKSIVWLRIWNERLMLRRASWGTASVLKAEGFCIFLVPRAWLQKALMFSEQRHKAFRFHRPQIFLVELGGSGLWECLASFFFFFFWSHPASRGFLMSNVAISKDMATVVCVCESAYECFMHVCDWLWVLTDVFLIAICLLCSRGSRRRNSLRFSRAWWSSWIKTCTVPTTTWSRSAQNTEEEPHTHLRNLHWSQKSSIFQINKWMNSSFNFTLLPAQNTKVKTHFLLYCSGF